MERRKSDRRRNNANEEPNVLDLIRIVFKRAFLVAVITLLPTVSAFIYLKKLPDMYKATASVLLEAQEINLADFNDILTGMKFDNLTVPTQVQVIGSPALIKRTLATLDLAMDSKGALKKRSTIADESGTAAQGADRDAQDYKIFKAFSDALDVKQQGTSRVIEITFTSSEAALAAEVVNAHAEQYLLSKQKDKQDLAKTIDTWLTKQIGDLKDQSLKKSRAAQQFRAENGMVQGEGSQELIFAQISSLAKEIARIESKALDLQARHELMSKNGAYGTSDVVGSPLIQELKSRASLSAQKLKSLRSQYGPNHPEVTAARDEVAQINRDLDREVSNIKKSVENELVAVRNQQQILERNLETLQTAASGMQEKMIMLQTLKTEEQASMNLLDSFLARSEEIKSQIDFTRPDVSISSLADIPRDPVSSKKLLILLAVSAFSFMVALCVVFVLEISERGLKTRDEINKLAGLSVTGALPRTRLPISNIIKNDRSLFIEEIKRLFIHISAEGKGKTLLFTSSRRGEGKSTLAAAVAYYMRNIGLKVLLIDADTLNPVMAGVTMTPPSPGLYEMLSGRQPPDKAYSRDRHGLFVMPSGERTPYLSDLILGGKLQPYLERLRTQFDFIIFDCAPVLSVSDAEALSALVDQTLIVLEWGVTPREEFVKAAEILIKTSKVKPSVVFNKVRLSEIESFRVY